MSSAPKVKSIIDSAQKMSDKDKPYTGSQSRKAQDEDAKLIKNMVLPIYRPEFSSEIEPVQQKDRQKSSMRFSQSLLPERTISEQNADVQIPANAIQQLSTKLDNVILEQQKIRKMITEVANQLRTDERSHYDKLKKQIISLFENQQLLDEKIQSVIGSSNMEAISAQIKEIQGQLQKLNQ